MMTLEAMTRLLKQNGNCNVHVDTFNFYGKQTIEKECGFEIDVKPSNCDEDNYILEKKESK